MARNSEEFLNHRKALARLQYEKAALTGWMGPTAVAAAFVGVIALSLWQRHQLTGAARLEQDGPPPPSDACVAESGGPLSPTLAVFLIADTHIHELGGQRFPGQMEIVNAIMSVSRRPVELDMLSSAPVMRFGTVFDQIARERKDRQLPAPLWAHLGDFSDLSCVDEMKRGLGLTKHYSAGGRMLAGFAPGSHDMSFHGNFDWSPYWNRACVSSADDASSSQRLDKARMDPLLASVLSDQLVSGNTSTGLSGWDMTRLSPNRPLSRFTITRLGTLPVDALPGRRRGVMGVFLDTTDRATPNYGIAGAVVSFSSQQGRAILKQIELAKAAAASPAASSPEEQAWADPWFVLMGHSPYRELSPSSKEALNALIVKLDRPQGPCQPPDEACSRPRVLALLAAHVHTAETHRHCIGSRLLRDIVIGSTLDPPQEAALLEIGLDSRKHAAMRVSSVPTIARPGFVCSSAYAVSAARCRQIVADLATSPDCTDLVAGRNTQGVSDTTCEEMERPLSLTEKIRGIARHGGPDDEKAIAATETRRGRALVRCVCRNVGEDLRKACTDARESPLKDTAYAPVVEALSREPGRQDELTCLAWAASAVQQHKSSGMTMSDALRCSFDDPTLQPAQVVTATTEEMPCY